MKKYKPVKIFCQKCNSHVGTWDGRSTINHITRCNKRRKRVIYHIETGETEVKDIPKRNCSSGMTFIVCIVGLKPSPLGETFR